MFAMGKLQDFGLEFTEPGRLFKNIHFKEFSFRGVRI